MFNSDVFEDLLRDAAERSNAIDLDLQFSKYDCIVGELPTEHELGEIDALLMTGSGKYLS